MKRWQYIRTYLAFLVSTLPLTVLVLASTLATSTLEYRRLSALLVHSIEPLFRTAVIAALATIFVTSISLILAIVAVRPWLQQRTTAILAICITTPLAISILLSGTSSFAFLWQRPFAETLLDFAQFFSNRSSLSVGTVDIGAQIVRYGPIATWLLIIAVLKTPPHIHQYAQSINIRSYDFFRIELISVWMPSVLIVGAFVFQDAFNDYIITQLSLRPSPATHTELISHFLNRIFTSLAIGRSASDASSALVGMSLVSAAVSAITFSTVGAFVISTTRTFRIGSGHLPSQRVTDVERSSCAYNWPQLILVLFSLALFFGFVFKLNSASSSELHFPMELQNTFSISLAVAVICWCIAVTICFAVREGVSEATDPLNEECSLWPPSLFLWDSFLQLASPHRST